MSRLTSKQEAFTLAYHETSNASEAYRRAYNVRPTTPAQNIHVAGCTLLSHSKIAQRLAELREKTVAPVLERARVDVQWVLDRSLELIAYGMERPPGGIGAMRDPKAATANLERIARYTGGFVDRREVSGPAGGAIPIEVTERLRSIVADADLATLERLALNAAPAE